MKDAQYVEGTISEGSDVADKIMQEKDTTFTTTTAGSIETRIISNSHVSSTGNLVRTTVTVPISKVDSVENASARSLRNQQSTTQKIQTKLLDSLKVFR